MHNSGDFALSVTESIIHTHQSELATRLFYSFRKRKIQKIFRSWCLDGVVTPNIVILQ